VVAGADVRLHDRGCSELPHPAPVPPARGAAWHSWGGYKKHVLIEASGRFPAPLPRRSFAPRSCCRPHSWLLLQH